MIQEDCYTHWSAGTMVMQKILFGHRRCQSCLAKALLFPTLHVATLGAETSSYTTIHLHLW